jgi:eukaryotic-like serine/threonine-protein kinase
MISQTISHYRILKKLGAGGMGEVYLAEDTKLNRKVAIKFLPHDTSTDERARKRLLREAQAAATLDHPNICAIYEVNDEGPESFIVMQYLEGETLFSKAQRTPLSLKESLDVAVQIADALTEAHSRGIIHRDIKPQNVMCTPRGQAKVMDFGLAKISHENVDSSSEASTENLLTEPGTVVGTLIYMSPEQVKGEAIDARSDVFSFGSLLYELLTGKQPFAGPNPAGTISAILTTQPAPLTRYSDVPDELQRIVSKCLAKDRERRYSSARELLVDLRNLKSDSEEAAVRTSVAAPQVSNRKLVYVLAGLALAGGLAAAFYFNRHQRTPEAKAIHSVAILPFASSSADPNVDYLGDGVTESLINSLSKLSQLKVIARSTAFKYKGKEIDPQAAGRELQVDAIITGTVTQQSDSLIIQADLLDTADGSQIWGGRYSRRTSDLFAVQEQIAKEISGALPLTLTGQETQGLSKRYTNNISAYQNYLQGVRYSQRRTHDDLLRGIEYFNKAIQTDSNYALAYAGLADAYSQLVTRVYISPAEGRRKASEAAIKTLALDPNLAEAHSAIGGIYVFFAPHDFSTGDRELHRAIELSPNLASAHQFLGISLFQQGYLDEGMAEELKAQELDPLSPTIGRSLAVGYYLKRDYPHALEALKNSLELGPAFVIAVEAEIYVQSRQLDEATKELDKAVQQRGNDPILVYSRAMFNAARRHRAEAIQGAKELEMRAENGVGYTQWIPRIYSTLNEKELALEWLNRGIDTEAIAVLYKDAPVWDPIRNDPRFNELLRKMQIPVK